MTAATQRLRERVRALLAQLSDFLPARLLDKREAFGVLRRLVNPDPRKAALPRLKYDTHVDYYACDSPLEAYRDHLRLGGHVVRTVTLKDPPAQTWPLVLRKLYELPANYHIVTEWHALAPEEARRIIATARCHHHIQKTSFAAHLQDAPSPNEVLVDESKGALVKSLGEALTDMEMRGSYFGEYSLTIVFYDRDRAVVDRAGTHGERAPPLVPRQRG